MLIAQVPALGEAGVDAGDWSRAPVRAFAMLAAMVAILAASVIAGWDLVRAPLRSSSGRIASRLALLNVLLLPVVWTVSHVVRPLGVVFHAGWGMPWFPVWLASGAGALGAALVDRDERSRAVLVFAALFGAAALTFFLGDMVAN